MFGLSLGHIIILLVVILLFGAKRLPDVGSALGKGLRNFKRGFEGKELDHDDSDSNRKVANRSDDPPR